MEEIEKKNESEAAPAVASPEVSMPEKAAEAAPVAKGGKSTIPWIGYVVALVALLAIAAGVVYLMEKDGRLSTGIFVPADGIAPNSTIATVNDVKIKGSELSTSINQITTSASLQGIDTTDSAVQENIRNQAVEMLVNTELLRQEAGKREVTVTDEDVTARIDALVAEVGSQELLNERMASLGIDEKTLRRDVRSELLIQKLLDQVFADKNITVSEEEINNVYESAGGEEAGLPPLAEVRDQVVAQVKAGKEQSILDELLAELRAAATVVIAE